MRTTYRLGCGHLATVPGPWGATTGRAWCDRCGASAAVRAVLEADDDDGQTDYYPDEQGYALGGEQVTYRQLVKAVQQAGERAMIHDHPEGVGYCMDRGCELWIPYGELQADHDHDEPGYQGSEVYAERFADDDVPAAYVIDGGQGHAYFLDGGALMAAPLDRDGAPVWGDAVDVDFDRIDLAAREAALQALGRLTGGQR